MSIILYTNDCPRCHILESKLEEKHLCFQRFDDVDGMIKMGFREAPILEVDGLRMQFGDAVKWVNDYTEDNI